MASPQIEDGFTKIANELLEALCRTRINGEAIQIFNAILRQTYGYKRKEAEISAEKFTELTGLIRQTQYKARQKLIAMNIITVTPKDSNKYLIYSIQKDYDKWQTSPKKVTLCNPKKRNPKRLRSVTQKGYVRNPKRLRSVTQKGYVAPPDALTGKAEREPKERKKYIKKKERVRTKNVRTQSPLFSKDSEEYKLAEYHLTQILEISPNIKRPSLQSWARDFDYMMRLDGRKPDEIRAVIDWIFKSDERDALFWRKNILSPGSMRKKKDGIQTFDRLVRQMSQSKPVKERDEHGIMWDRS